ncbi:hypothetical protein [Microtetraspora niveoalba]|uniref:hypothetical protein n=1 Tax=Microtetraspora niveoalba TaxID=46175 RepID=UPI00082D7AC3|nr:hypothetical protein [Microtetraspora niveoalba]
MRVEIDTEVLRNDEHVRHVWELLLFFSQGRHDWVIKPMAVDQAAEFFRTHLPTQARVGAEMAMKAGAAGAWAVDVRPVHVITTSTISEDVHDLRQPAALVVEDVVSDRCFVLAITRVLDGDDVRAAIERGFLDLRHGGGKHRAAQQTADCLARFRRTPRVALLLDSDRLAPGQVTGCHKLADELRSQGARVHVLELREAENYVPNKVLGGIRPHRESSKRLDALKSLSRTQRGHFDMKKGFPPANGGRRKISDLHAGLYDDLPDRVMDGLREGFGSNLTELLHRAANAGRLTPSDFAGLGEGVLPELRELIAMLRDII